MTNELTIREIDNEPRIIDIELAEKLGMSRPRDIRKDLIKPNLAELQGFGILRETPANSGKRGRPALVYYLNEEQALLLCMFSRTEKAQAVRAQVIRVFKAYRNGELQPTAPVLPNFSDPVAAARAWADAMEQKVLAEKAAGHLSTVVDTNLRWVTIDEWRALSHVYLVHSQKTQLGKLAAARSRALGIEVGKQSRTVRTPYGEKVKSVGEYRIDIVNEVATEMGLDFTLVVL